MRPLPPKPGQLPTENHSTESWRRPPRSPTCARSHSEEEAGSQSEQNNEVGGWTEWGQIRSVRFAPVLSPAPAPFLRPIPSTERAADLEQIAWVKPCFWHRAQVRKKTFFIKKRLLQGAPGRHHHHRERCQNQVS